MKPTTDPEALVLAEIEIEFGHALWLRDYEGAAACLSRGLNRTLAISDSVGAWHLLWLGYCHECLGQFAEAREAYRRAHNISHNIPPLHLQDWSEPGLELPAQVFEVARYLQGDPLSLDRSIPKGFDLALSALDGTGTPDGVNEALRVLGQYLGLMSSRPDKEFHTGPDVFWDSDDGPALCLEVKSDKKPKSAYIKKDLGQLRDHHRWVLDRREGGTVYNAFVGLHLPPSLSANPDPDTDVIEVAEFRELAGRLRAALEDILARAIPATLPRTVFEVFERRDLIWPGLYASLRKSKLRDLRKSQGG